MVQEQLIGSGHVEWAVVLRRKDGAVRATSLGYQARGRETLAFVAPCLTHGPLSPYQPSEELIRAVLEAFRDPARAREHGLQFNGASYSCVRADQWAVYAKKVRLQSVLV